MTIYFWDNTTNKEKIMEINNTISSLNVTNLESGKMLNDLTHSNDVAKSNIDTSMNLVNDLKENTKLATEINNKIISSTDTANVSNNNIVNNTKIANDSNDVLLKSLDETKRYIASLDDGRNFPKLKEEIIDLQNTTTLNTKSINKNQEDIANNLKSIQTISTTLENNTKGINENNKLITDVKNNIEDLGDLVNKNNINYTQKINEINISMEAKINLDSIKCNYALHDGYVVYPWGKIEQWGYIHRMPRLVKVNLPIALENKDYNIQATGYGGESCVPTIKSYNQDKDGFCLQTSEPDKNDVFWFVVSWKR